MTAFSLCKFYSQHHKPNCRHQVFQKNFTSTTQKYTEYLQT